MSDTSVEYELSSNNFTTLWGAPTQYLVNFLFALLTREFTLGDKKKAVEHKLRSL